MIDSSAQKVVVRIGPYITPIFPTSFQPPPSLLVGTSVGGVLVSLFNMWSYWCIGRPVVQQKNLAYRSEHMYS